MSDGLRACHARQASPGEREGDARIGCHFDEAVHELPTAAGKIFTIPPWPRPPDERLTTAPAYPE